MSEPLHPLTLSEILDRTAQLYRSRFLVFVGIGTIPAGTVFVFAAGAFAFFLWMGVHTKNGGTIADSLMWAFLTFLVVLAIPASLATSAIGEAAMSDATARLFLGDSITIRSAYKATWKRGWRYVGLYLLQELVIVGAPGVVFFGAMFAMIAGKVRGVAANDDSPLFAGLLFSLLFILAVFATWMLLRLCLAFPASVVEQAPAWIALKRGVMLSQGTRARIFLLYVLGVLLSQILVWCVTFPILVAVALIPGLQGQAHAQTVGVAVSFITYSAYFVVKAMTKPIYGIALTVFYFDQRIRKEGFDIEWMMQQAGMLVPPATPGPTSEAASPVLAQEMPEFSDPLVVAAATSDSPETIPTHQAVLETKAEESNA